MYKLRLTDLVKDMRDVSVFGPVLLIALAASGLWIFLEIGHEVGENEMEAMDSFILLLFRDPKDLSQTIGPAWLEETMVEITALGGYPVLVLLVSAVIGFLLVSGRRGPALFVFLSIVSGSLVSHGLKLIYDRPRPDLVEHLVTIHTASFPSGHATMSTVVYLTLASLIVRLVEDWRVRIYVMSVAIATAVLIGVSRVYLGVHWPTDVMAGWAIGAAWASLSWLVVSVLRRLRGKGNPDAGY